MNTLEELRSGALLGAKRLTLSCALTEFPREIFQLKDSLEILDLSNNRLSSLPEEIKDLKNLNILFCSNNDFTEVPPQLAACESLSMVGFKANKITRFDEDALPVSVRWLILTDNRLNKLPDSIGRLARLQKCALAGNRIARLPDSMRQCRNLELLRISANNLTDLPEWLLGLPKLSWLAFSGNPISHKHDLSLSPLPHLDWHELTFHEVLGEGASGTIYRGRVKDSKDAYVALKLFKGDVTSDGLPGCEMDAALAAGKHEHLIPIEGKFSNHDEQQGLILSLIPDSFQSLGSPPDLETCTRDTYPNNPKFSSTFTLSVLTGIAKAAGHLHCQGIMHGDLYAHNILVDESGHAYLGDFGAATQYDRDDKQNRYFEYLDVRAFGCLIDDMLRHQAKPEGRGEERQFETLKRLQAACMNETIEDRPSFSEIIRHLNGL